MAGIGFVLEKILKEGGIGAFLKVALAGAVIVAGPWLLSLLGIFVITTYGIQTLEELRSLFTTTIIYSYSVSLFLFGGFHYYFSRQISDLIFEKRPSAAGSVLSTWVLFMLIVASTVGALGMAAFDLGQIDHPELFVLGAVLLFITVNVNWLLMVFISLLKWYQKVFTIYLLGMAGAFLAVRYLGTVGGVGGAVLGFALGHLFIAVSLFILVRRKFPSAGRPSPPAVLFRDLGRLRMLLIGGTIYYWGIWIDKFVFWFLRGSVMPGTSLRLFPAYDIPVYLAHLSIIPGLIFFVISGETDFFRKVRRFLRSLSDDIHASIRYRQKVLALSVLFHLREQVFFQGVISIVLIILSGRIAAYFQLENVAAFTFAITFLAMVFHFFLLVTIIYLFYLESFLEVLTIALIFFVVNLSGAILLIKLDLDAWIGVHYLVAAAISSVTGIILLVRTIRNLDRRIMIGYLMHPQR